MVESNVAHDESTLVSATGAISSTDLNLTTPHGESNPLRITSLYSPEILPLWRLYIIATAFFGIQFMWTLQFALSTPFLTETLRATVVTSHLVWLLGPLSGLITVPIVGYLSDHCPKGFPGGRRRPFIAAGALGATCGSVLFAHSKAIAKLIPSTKPILWAIIGFGMQDCSLNAAMFPLRALMGDVVSKEQQQDSQAALVAVGTAGELFASVFVGMWESPLDKIQVLFSIGAGLLATTVLISLLTGHENEVEVTEPPLDDEDQHADVQQQFLPSTESAEADDMFANQDTKHTNQPADESVDNLLWPPRREFLSITIVYALGWLSLFCCMPYLSSWLGRSVLHGDPTAPLHTVPYNLYQHGVTLYGRANSLKALLSLFLSLTYPRILHHITPQHLLALSFIPMIITLSIDALIPNKAFAVTSIALLAIPYVALHTTPFGLVSEYFPTARALFFALLNTAGVLAQAVDTLYTGPLAKVAGERAVLALGAVWAALAGIAAAVLL